MATPAILSIPHARAETEGTLVSTIKVTDALLDLRAIVPAQAVGTVDRQLADVSKRRLLTTDEVTAVLDAVEEAALLAPQPATVR
jgi:hypothetical protein